MTAPYFSLDRISVFHGRYRTRTLITHAEGSTPRKNR